jgi:hypothetical protein
VKIKELYYHGVPKDCANCFYRARLPLRWFTLSKCNKYPNWLTGDAMAECKYKEWIPNGELVKKYEKEEL